MINPLCPHRRKRFARAISSNGATHIMDQCLDCGGNARGTGRWVPASSCREDPATLPVAHDHRSPEARGEQPLLF